MIGALISAGSSILGGILGNKSAKKAAAQEHARQVQFAQNGIQWKVQDAKKAGIHPLYALGANTVSYSPTQIGPTDFGFSQAGQDIGRAIDSGRSANERTAALSSRAAALQLQNMELQNQKLASEIALTNQAGTPPPPITENAVITGQGVSMQPVPQSPAVIGQPARDAGINPEITFTQGVRGYIPQVSENTKKALEDMPLGETQWEIRNRVMPSLGNRSATTAPPKSWLPYGSNTWKYEPLTGEWRPWNSHTKTYGRMRNL